jgi:hypothetical protein
MKRGLSTGKPTKREAERIVACKEGACVACTKWMGHGFGFVGCDYHHLKSGNIRRGHRFGIALCIWHHRGIPSKGMSAAQMRESFGPSLMDGSRIFRDAYGGDDYLLGMQDEMIGWRTD